MKYDENLEGAASDNYMLKRTVTPYVKDEDIRLNTQVPTNPRDINFISNYKGAIGEVDQYPTSVPYQGEKHWNIDRFVIDPQFSTGYSALENFDEDTDKTQQRRNTLADMYKYFMLQNKGDRDTSWKQANEFMTKEIDPRISGPVYNTLRGDETLSRLTKSITGMIDEDYLTNFNSLKNEANLPDSDRSEVGRDFLKNPASDKQAKDLAMDWLVNYKKMSSKQAEQYYNKLPKTNEEYYKNLIKKEGKSKNNKRTITVLDSKEMQNGGEMKFYQEGLDFKPKSMQKGGKTTTKFLPPQFKRDEEEEIKPNPISENTIEEIEPKIDGGFWEVPIEKLETIDPYEKKIDRIKRQAPKELIEESSSPYRYNMLRDAVRHDIASERGVALTDINEDELTDRTEQLLSKKEKQLYKIPITSLDYNMKNHIQDSVKELASWNSINNSISLNSVLHDYLDFPKPYEKAGDQLFKDVLMHELRHSYDKGAEYLTNYEQKIISDKSKKDISIYDDKPWIDYVNSPWEITARLQEIRSSLKSTGKYDASKDKATIENLKEAHQSRAYRDLLKIMKPQDIVDLLNTIAANSPKQGMPAAKNGKKIIKDDRGQWDHPGEITEIGSNQITMRGVPYPVMGISDTGDTQMMYPNEDYVYDGESVTEIPMMAQGGQLTKLDQLTNFTNYNTKQPGGWLDKYQ
jgi:hypothetical protein